MARRPGRNFTPRWGLQSFGTDLNHNALWQSLSPEEKTAWKSLLDTLLRSEDAQVYSSAGKLFWRAARIAAISYKVGVTTDRADVDDLLDRWPPVAHHTNAQATPQVEFNCQSIEFTM